MTDITPEKPENRQESCSLCLCKNNFWCRTPGPLSDEISEPKNGLSGQGKDNSFHCQGADLMRELGSGGGFGCRVIEMEPIQLSLA